MEMTMPSKMLMLETAMDMKMISKIQMKCKNCNIVIITNFANSHKKNKVRIRVFHATGISLTQKKHMFLMIRLKIY